MMGPGTGGDDIGSDSNVTAVALPQAIDGAFFANPDAFATIPMHVVTTGHAGHVAVSIDGTAVDAAADSDVQWTASLDISALSDGTHDVVADADGVQATATLVVNRGDIQFTQISIDQNAATPRLHRLGDHLVLTWTDIATGTRVAWMQQIDGGGRHTSDRIPLVGGAGQEDVLYARTALGVDNVGVLYQQRGGPYVNFFTVVARDGSTVVAAMPLDGDQFGSNGGDVVYDGTSGFDVTWRTNDGMGNSKVHWMNVDEVSGEVTGPIVVAEPGDDDPHAGFDPITNVAVMHQGDASLVAFSRYEHDASLDLDVLRCQVATIQGGAVTQTVLAGVGGGFFWDDDCRVLDGGTAPVAVWARKSLTSSADNPPDVFAGARVANGELDAGRGNGATMVDAPESREEPWMVPTTAQPILAWTDSRSYDTDITTGQVQLYAAVVGADLATSHEVLFPHTHFVEGTGDVHGAPAGSNAILTWIDERHGGSVLDPHPEVYLETVWQ
jgi:hypothetical protein